MTQVQATLGSSQIRLGVACHLSITSASNGCIAYITIANMVWETTLNTLCI